MDIITLVICLSFLVFAGENLQFVIDGVKPTGTSQYEWSGTGHKLGKYTNFLNTPNTGDSRQSMFISGKNKYQWEVTTNENGKHYVCEYSLVFGKILCIFL